MIVLTLENESKQFCTTKCKHWRRLSSDISTKNPNMDDWLTGLFLIPLYHYTNIIVANDDHACLGSF